MLGRPRSQAEGCFAGDFPHVWPISSKCHVMLAGHDVVVEAHSLCPRSVVCDLCSGCYISLLKA